jgi:PleD family two-component response regulator
VPDRPHWGAHTPKGISDVVYRPLDGTEVASNSGTNRRRAARVEDCLRRALDGIQEDMETGLNTHAYVRCQIDQANRSIASLLQHFGDFVRAAASTVCGV